MLFIANVKKKGIINRSMYVKK